MLIHALNAALCFLRACFTYCPCDCGTYKSRSLALPPVSNSGSISSRHGFAIGRACGLSYLVDDGSERAMTSNCDAAAEVCEAGAEALATGGAARHDRFNMDGHKLFWHLDRVAAWQKGERIAPLHIDMGISTGCNMACSYCYGVIQGRAGYGTDNKGLFHMPREAIERTFREAKAAGVRSIALIGEGENTLNPHLYDVLDYARTIGLDLSLATNGIRIDLNRLGTLLTALTWLRVNISAATPESFLRIHRVPQFDRVLDNVRAMVDAKRTRGYPCTIGLQMVVTKDNADDIVPLARLGRELGVDYLVIKSCSDTYDGTLDAPREEYKALHDTFREAERCAGNGYVVSIKWSKINNSGWKDYDVCYGTQFLMAISGNGNVFPCGHWFDVRTKEFLMGNVIQQSFSEIISSERYWEVQNRVQSVNVNRDCESNCRQHYINRFLSSIKNVPDHVNFI